MKFLNSQRGFTLIEILMVILLVAILSAVAIPQFLDFRTEARNGATQSAVGAVRTGIATQYANSIVRCNVTPGTWPTLAQVNANDITVGGPCTSPAMIPAAEVRFTADTQLPINPWSVNPAVAAARTAVACAGTGCPAGGGANYFANDCIGGPRAANTGSGWCYDNTTGRIWANSNRNPAANENSF